MNREIRYWKWKSTIIDFNTISDEALDYADYPKKKDWVFRYLGIPDNDIHEWYNGGFSSEYNRALKYAEELGLIEDYIDYDDIIYELKEQLETGEQQYNHLVEEKEELQEQLSSIAFQLEKQKEILEKANKKIEKMFDDGDENKVIDDLIEIQKILDIDKGE